MCEELGDYERARTLLEHNLTRAQALGNAPMEGQTLAGLAGLALGQGRAQDAVTLLKDVLRIDRDLGMRLQTSFDLSRFARALALAGGAGADAARLLASAENIRLEIGAGVAPYLATIHAEALAIIRRQVDEDIFEEAWEEGLTLTDDEAVALALDTNLDA